MKLHVIARRAGIYQLGYQEFLNVELRDGVFFARFPAGPDAPAHDDLQIEVRLLEIDTFADLVKRVAELERQVL